jgi:transposase-like protein
MVRRRFTKEFKLEVAREVEGGLSVVEASRRYEVHPSLINKWRDSYRKHGENSFPGNGNLHREEAKIAMLERKIGQLTMENEFLKKVIALKRNLRKTDERNVR